MPSETAPPPEDVFNDAVRTRRRGRMAGFLIGAVLVLIAVVLLTLLSRCSDDEPSAAVPASPSPAATAPAPTGIVNAGDQVLLPLRGPASLKAYAGLEAIAVSAPVQSVPADEGFWVGTSGTDRVWVQITTPQGESPFVVKAGDEVAFTGKVEANGTGFRPRAGLTDAEGGGQLDAQGFHVAVARSSMKLL